VKAKTVPEPLLPELRKLADATGDPWFDLLAIEVEARALEARGESEREEVALLRALSKCDPRWLEFRCARLEFRLATSYLDMSRLPESEQLTRAVWARARRTGDWSLEKRALQLLANLESLSGEVGAKRLSVARAYVGEIARRNPDRCQDLSWGRELLAMMLVNRLDLAGARRELAEAAKIRAKCPQARLDPDRVFTEAHVLRDPAAPPAEVAALRAEIAELRRDADPGRRAFLDHVEGRLLIERDRAAATVLLEQSIATAGAAPGDAEARRARSYSYAVLALDAARAGEWERVWKLLGEEAGFAPADRCTVGVAVDDDRALAVIRDAAGAIHGHFDGRRGAPAPAANDEAVRTLVPEALRARLAACEAVEVVARAPIHGAPALFGGDVAWSYRSGRAPSAEAPPAAGHTLVIANTEPPAALALPQLAAWRSKLAPDRILEGRGATPSRALAELAEARYVELHVHGMVNAAVADAASLLMSPEPDGRHALTAAMIRKQPLRGRPIVVLAACHAASTAPNLFQSWSLPAAFIDAGARAVIASTGVIDDASAGAFFDDLRARLDRGVSPPIALRAARTEWLAAHPAAAWVRSLMVFQ
jgi:tetratricopeptide (TPR) repeat protein